MTNTEAIQRLKSGEVLSDYDGDLFKLRDGVLWILDGEWKNFGMFTGCDELGIPHYMYRDEGPIFLDPGVQS